MALPRGFGGSGDAVTGGRRGCGPAGRRAGARRQAVLVAAIFGFACSTGDPDPEPADGGRIQRTTARVDSQLNQAREHIRTIDTLGAEYE